MVVVVLSVVFSGKISQRKGKSFFFLFRLCKTKFNTIVTVIQPSWTVVVVVVVVVVVTVAVVVVVVVVVVVLVLVVVVVVVVVVVYSCSTCKWYNCSFKLT